MILTVAVSWFSLGVVSYSNMKFTVTQSFISLHDRFALIITITFVYLTHVMQLLLCMYFVQFWWAERSHGFSTCYNALFLVRFRLYRYPRKFLLGFTCRDCVYQVILPFKMRHLQLKIRKCLIKSLKKKKKKKQLILSSFLSSPAVSQIK